MLAAATTLVVPYGLRLLIDGGLTAGDTERLAVIRSQFLVLLALAMMMAIFTSARFYMVSWLGERITTDLRAVLKGVLGDHLQIASKQLDAEVFPESASVKPLQLLRG